MKFRQGFVSNSSTTSFTCQVCGQTEGYSDCCSLEDAGASECANGHVFCSGHKLKSPSEVPDFEKDLDDEDEYSSSVKAGFCPICTGKSMDLNLVTPFLLKQLGWTSTQIWREMQKLGTYADMLKYSLE